MASITLTAVGKSFASKSGKVDAVNAVSLHVCDGELMVLLGPSGCGKTTTLRLIAGLESPSQGEVAIGGVRVNEMSPKDRDVALVFQHFALYPHLNVRDNLAFGLKMRRVAKSEIQRRVEAVASQLEIGDLLGRRSHELSGGQQQRVALGRAIVRRPRVYLFDEPLANLDPRLRSLMRVELRRMHREMEMTALYVTHDQDEAMALGDRIGVMCDGRLQQVGTPREVYERPVNRFVAGFVGEPAMNFLSGRIDQRNGDVIFESQVGSVRVSPMLAERVGGRLGEEMILGVRPGHVSIVSGTDGIPCTVVCSFSMGDRTEVHVKTSQGKELILSDLSGRHWDEGESIAITFDPQRVCLFERGEPGMNVLYENSRMSGNCYAA